MNIFTRKLSQTELVKKLSITMPRGEYAALTTQIVSLAETDPKQNCGKILNLIG